MAILTQDPWLCSVFHKIHSQFGSRPLALFNVPQNPSPFWLKTLGFVECSTKSIAVLAQDPWICWMFHKSHGHFGSRPLALLNVPQTPSPFWLQTLGFVQRSTKSIAILAQDPWLCLPNFCDQNLGLTTRFVDKTFLLPNLFDHTCVWPLCWPLLDHVVRPTCFGLAFFDQTFVFAFFFSDQTCFV